MKLATYILTITIAATACFAQDINTKPESLEKVPFKFPEYTTKTLKNGLKVFLVEDHRQPIIGFNLNVYGGNSIDADKPGTAELTASMLLKAADKLSEEQIMEFIESRGANLTVRTSDDMISLRASFLKKNQKELLDIISKVLLNPTFPKDELKVLVKNKTSQIEYDKTNSASLAIQLAKKIVLGTSHPYAQKPTSQDLKEISIDDIKKFYSTWFVPNNASLAIYGNIKMNEILPELERLFGKWKKAELPEFDFPKPSPMPLGVHFIKRPGAVQSSVFIASRGLPYNENDYEMLELASDIMSGGVGGRLFQNLREKHSYTYSPIGFLSRNKFTNYAVFGADVRTDVTDSAIKVVLDLMSDLTSNTVGEVELNRAKKYAVGSYLMALQSPAYIASLVQNIDFYNLSVSRYKNFDEKRMGASSMSVLKAAKTHFNPLNSWIIVVGSPDIESKLANFGKVYEYDADLNTLTGESGKFEKTSISPKQLILKYMESMGGKKMTEIITIEKNAAALMNYPGQPDIAGTLVIKQKSPDKLHQKIDMNFFAQELWVNGNESFLRSNNQTEKETGILNERSILSSKIFPVPELIDLGYKLQVLGIQSGYIVMKAESPLAAVSTYYFNQNDYLLAKRETLEDNPQGKFPVTEEYNDYQNINGVMFPKTVIEKNPYFKITFNFNYLINQEIDDSIFFPRTDDK